MLGQRAALLRRIIEYSRLYFHRHLALGGGREWAEVDLTMPQLKMLFVVAASQGMSMTQLARSVGMTLSTATGVADRLIAQDLARRDSVPDDRRVVLLHPTAEGIALVDRLTQVADAQFAAIAKRLTTEELAIVAQASELLYRAMLETPRDELTAKADPSASGQRADSWDDHRDDTGVTPELPGSRQPSQI